MSGDPPSGGGRVRRRAAGPRGLLPSREGWIALGASGAAIFFGWLYTLNPLLLLGLFALGLCALSRPFARSCLGALELRRAVPSRAEVDRFFAVRVQLLNRHSLLPAGGVELEEGIEGLRTAIGGTVFPWIGPRAAAGSRYLMVLRRRGLHRFAGARLRSTFPLGLFRVEVRREFPSQLIVHPRTGRIAQEFLSEVENFQRQLRRRTPSRVAEEFRGLREYRHGDNPRWVHWKSSAKYRQLVVKEHEEPRSRRLSVLLESCVPSASGKSPESLRRWRLRVEMGISFVATLAHACFQREMELRVALSVPEPRVLQVGRDRRGLRELLDALAALDHAAEPTLPELIRRVPGRMLRDGLVLLVLPDAELAPSASDRGRLQQLGAGVWELVVGSRRFQRVFRMQDPVRRFSSERERARRGAGVLAQAEEEEVVR